MFTMQTLHSKNHQHRMFSIILCFTSSGKPNCSLFQVIIYLFSIFIEIKISWNFFLFSLDVEGSELQILKSIPFEKVDIKVLDIEHKHMGDIFPGSFQELKAFLELKGYDYHMQIRDPLGYPNDVVFVKRGFLNEIKEMQKKINDEL